MVGEYLRGKRQEAGLSLEALSEKTLIRKTYLEALEREDFKFINGDVYVRGYIKTYLRALNISPEEAIRLYEEDLRKKQKEEGQIPPPTKTTPRILYLIPVALLSMAVVITFILLSGSDNINNKTTSSNGNDINVVMPLKEAEARFENKEVLEINAIDETWIYLVIDNKLKYSLLLQPGENKRWTADKGFFLKIGNAGGLEITYNGIKYGIPGKKGQVIRLHFPEDLQKLTARGNAPETHTSQESHN